MSFPLSGVRVLDLTRLVPGAFATLMLAELGAEVIKVEDPRGGDPTRQLPPLVDGRSIYDVLLNRGKRSIALDLRDAASRATLDRLIARSDIVVESFRPGAARRLGVSGEQIRATHPGVIHCSITGYGQSGPYAELPGHDLNYVAISGLLAADRPDPTQLPHMFIADIGAGAMTSVIGMLAALVGRARTGEGQSIDLSMHEAALYWLMLPAARDLVDGGERASDALPTFGDHASYNVYRTKDDQLIALGALELKFWQTFCERIGRPELTSRHRSTPADQAALLDEVRAIFRTRTRDEWLTFFRGHDVCLTPVNQPAEALRDPHVLARGVIKSVPGLRTILPPFTKETPTLAPAPTLGQDTDEVLRDWVPRALPKGS
jgi:crotonobetainyl-CoA:carnitine CoA-transferase CaiB-like acyl-CoA transferase